MRTQNLRVSIRNRWFLKENLDESVGCIAMIEEWASTSTSPSHRPTSIPLSIIIGVINNLVALRTIREKRMRFYGLPCMASHWEAVRVAHPSLLPLPPAAAFLLPAVHHLPPPLLPPSSTITYLSQNRHISATICRHWLLFVRRLVSAIAVTVHCHLQSPLFVITILCRCHLPPRLVINVKEDYFVLIRCFLSFS